MSKDFYDRSLTRIVRIAIALGAIGTIFTLFKHGPWLALGFAAGSAISLVNFGSLRRLATDLGAGGKAPMNGSAVFFGLRYVILGGVIYAIVKVFGISLMSVLAGLFVSAAAIIVEILYELIYART